ncbi:MAG: DUF58 domain-containing protein [Peptoniphilaceae bacterium]|nr:DUF58 domain-containing protein [Peptoniphilaceae bacterium]
MKRIRLRFLFWIVGWVALFLFANTKLRLFPHILIIFWSLLPIVSLLFSVILARGLAMKEELSPRALVHGEAGVHEWRLENRTRFMAFYVFLPQLMPGQKKATPLMLQPQEKRTFTMPFSLDQVGHFTLRAGGSPLLYYEDLLGFFLLKKKMPVVPPLTCDALPDRSYLRKLPSFADRLTEEGVSVDRPTRSTNTDEIYSVDPMREGESLSRAHWKLSARLQQWMIKHYSDVEQEPQRILIDPLNVPDAASYPEYDGKVRDPALVDVLEKRTAFLDTVYSTISSLIEANVPVNVSNRTSEFLNLDEAADEPLLAKWIAELPFSTSGLDWRISLLQGQRQIFWIQKIDEETLGSLMEALRQGVSFVVITERHANDRDMVERVAHSGIPVDFLDEEEV